MDNAVTSRDRLYQFLNQLGRNVQSRYPNLNAGGCGVYASIVATELSNLGIPVCGIVGTNTSAFVNHIDEARNHVSRNNVKSWEDNGIILSHVGIEFKVRGYTNSYDSTGVQPANTLGNWMVYRGRLTVEELKEIASSAEGWNTDFKRRDIPNIELIVQSSFRRLRVVSPGSVRMFVNRARSMFK